MRQSQTLTRTLDPLAMRTEFAWGAGYLDTATYGLPPARTVAAMRRALEDWQAGRATPAGYDLKVNEARELYARLVNVPTDHVSVGSQTSVFAGMVAASLPAGSTVVAADCDFTSLLFPFLAARARGIEVRLVPLEKVAHAIDDATTLVAVSAVQSKNGAIAHLSAILDAARAHGARTFVDTTQSCGWMPLDAGCFDYTVTSAYKWLLAPRGTAFFTAGPEAQETLLPVNAGWYAGEDIWDSIYGGPLRLAPSARSLDVSPAWLAWVGAVPSLELIHQIGVEAINAHDLALANAFREALGLLPESSPIVSLEMSSSVARLLDAARLHVSLRDGALRLSFHLYNTFDDVERALDALGSRVLVSN